MPFAEFRSRRTPLMSLPTLSLSAWRRLDKVPPDLPAARLWLLAVARRVLANQRRGKSRQASLAEQLRVHIEIPAPKLSSDLQDLPVVPRWGVLVPPTRNYCAWPVGSA